MESVPVQAPAAYTKLDVLARDEGDVTQDSSQLFAEWSSRSPPSILRRKMTFLRLHGKARKVFYDKRFYVTQMHHAPH